MNRISLTILSNAVRISALLLLVTLCRQSANAEGQVIKGAESREFKVIRVDWSRKNKLQLHFRAAAEHAIQISSYNKLALVTASGEQSLKLTGKPLQDKPDYYSNIDVLELDNPPGSATLKGKLLYCNLVQNFCSQEKFSLTL
jgi:hypothetical protein